MNFKKISLIASLAFALSTPAWSQDATDGSATDDGEWASAPEESASETSSDSASVGSDVPAYDGSADAEFADDEEYASAYAKYKAETTKKADIERQRTEGFARPIMLGFRAQGGINTFLGENSDGWGMGFQIGAGIVLKMNLGIKNLSLVPELTFNFRRYSYEKDMDIYTNKATIKVTMFEIPIIIRYTFEDYDFYVGLGLNLGLKLNGSSEFKGSGDSRYNTVATNSFEAGAALDLGYMIARNTYLNLRVIQCFTSLLNKTLVDEPSFYNSSLDTFQATAGISFLF